MADHKHHSVVFPSTDWEQVRQAATLGTEDGRLALEQLCQTYRQVIRACMASMSHVKAQSAVMDVDDLTQEFLSTDFLQRLVPQADESRGHFRHFILHGLRLFLMSHREKLSAKKRGGGIVHESIEDQEWMPGQKCNFRPLDRPWALHTFQCAVRRMKERYEKSGDMEKFHELWELLWSDTSFRRGFLESSPGVRADALTQRLRRFRIGLRECLRHEVEKTVLRDSAQGSVDAVDEEMAHLLEVLAKEVPPELLYGCL